MLEKIKQSLSKKAVYVDVYVDVNENVDEDVDVDVDDDDDDVLIRGGEEDDDNRTQNFGEQNKRKLNRKMTPKMNPVRKKLSCYKICIALRRCIFDFNERKMQNSIRGNKRMLVHLKRKIQIYNIKQHIDDSIMKKQVCQIAQSAAKNMLKQSEIATNFLEICCL